MLGRSEGKMIGGKMIFQRPDGGIFLPEIILPFGWATIV
jgi:hypothetical protein